MNSSWQILFIILALMAFIYIVLASPQDKLLITIYNSCLHYSIIFMKSHAFSASTVYFHFLCSNEITNTIIMLRLLWFILGGLLRNKNIKEYSFQLNEMIEGKLLQQVGYMERVLLCPVQVDPVLEMLSDFHRVGIIDLGTLGEKVVWTIFLISEMKK